MNYLQKIRVLLQEKTCEDKLFTLKGKLQEAGIELTAECIRPQKEGQAGQRAEVFEPKDVSGMLWITDSGAAAGKLSSLGLPVLAYFHEKNGGEDFSGLKYAMEEPQEMDVQYFERVYRRLVGLPWEILTTERCLIRETTPEDVDAFYEIYSHPSITKYTEGLYPQVEQEKQYVREYAQKVYAFYDFGVWTVTERETGDVIGRAGFSYRAGFAQPELGFVIGVPWQRKGIAFEVCQAVLRYGRERLGFQKVNAMVCPENNASRRLCSRLGFREMETVELDGQRYLRMEKTYL
ncbi:GNAT family N-acetyltransferase [Candidatus Acetatifactor stercoripullorum]|uniref:GNAT family N-acetyltransferase n=1 Tax=Candidatus Acetatifactor stercoripullorum TaxID=2838414 RepID=UPI00298DD5D8|nr:GNAT family N-acetyltransferase [Candidatus Acetatifactor stercoripullorum]